MKKFPLSVLAIALVLSAVGCSHQTTAKPQRSVTTGVAANRQQRVEEAARDFRAKGYSEERARQAAERQVPFVETTYSESLSSMVGGEDKQQKFEADLAKSEAGRRR